MAGIELKGRWEDRMGARVCQNLRGRGIILRPLGNVIVVMPPLAISTKQLDYLMRVLFEELQDNFN
jgi:adenosylmethionine-8-amino-7-oxononanoate aminotransferase